jgi:hypothetical protein
MWLSIESDRIARYGRFELSNKSLPRTSFETKHSATVVINAITGNSDYIDPLYISQLSMLILVSIEFVVDSQKRRASRLK